MRQWSVRIATLLILSLFTLHISAAPKLTEQWSFKGLFGMPESAAYDPKRQMVYVSNVNHYAKDNNGYISRISADGQHADIKWLTGLHSPTGLTVSGDLLYAVDFDALVMIDLSTGAISKRIPAPDADKLPVLNDVAVAEDGTVFVSGSRSRTIYHLEDGELNVWLQDDERLQSANGLLVYKNWLLHGGERWSVFDLATRKPVTAFAGMAKGLRDFDGITALGNDTFLVSLIDDGRLWKLSMGAEPVPLSDDGVNGIDMQYVPEQQQLWLPRVGNTLTLYTIDSR